MKKIILTFLAASAMLPASMQAQRVCGTDEHHHHLMQTDPEYVKQREQIEQHTQQYVQNPTQTRAVVTIPVVVHVVYNTATQNISDAQIQSQMTVLNNDFRKLNADWTLTPSAFQGLVADCEVNFCLAQQDPNGNPTTGIVRKSTTVTSFSSNNAVKYDAQGGSNAWDRSRYLNIWVCNLGGGLLGYAQFPGGGAATDGVVCTHTGFGTTGTAAAPFNKGRTATHEVGHWLNLYHIWGDDGTGCTGSDQVGDTPNAGGPNYGCPGFPKVSCSNGPNGDMFMNYMDYTDDACMYMFTAGQKTRLSALFAVGGARASLTTSNGCTPPSGTTCGTPSGVNATGITTSGATIGWTAVAGASSYNVQYKLSTATTWTTTTSSTNSKALTGLTAATAYNVKVQAVCTGGSSTYSSPITFTTSTAGGGGTCTNNYEPNETRTSATSVAVNTDIVSMIGTSTDKDYYKIVTTTAAPKLKVTLTNLPFDYDLKLYRSNGTLLATAQNGGTSSETITYNTGTSGATYFLHVYGYNGAFSASQCYTLRANTSATNFRLDGSEEQMEKAALNVFPNPANDKAGIQFFAVGNQEVVVNLYNAMGQKLQSIQAVTVEGENNLYVDLSTFSSGMYMLELIEGEERKIQKFTIQK